MKSFAHFTIVKLQCVLHTKNKKNKRMAKIKEQIKWVIQVFIMRITFALTLPCVNIVFMQISLQYQQIDSLEHQYNPLQL